MMAESTAISIENGHQAVHDDVDILNHHRILVTLHIRFRTIRREGAVWLVSVWVDPGVVMFPQ